MKNNNFLCFVAGKSGGHIIPCLTIASRYKQKNPAIKFLFFSTNASLDKQILSNNPDIEKHVLLPLKNLAGTSFLHYPKVLLHIIISCITSFFYLCKYRPTQVITTGSIIAVPVCISAFILRIPITLYSLDAYPGKAIRLLAPLATHIITCFAHTQKYFSAHKCTYQPYPIKYTTKHTHENISSIKKQLGLENNKITILILGGSQGSLFLNTCIQNLINHPDFCSQTFQFIHQTGAHDYNEIQKLYHAKNITCHVFNYNPNLNHLYLVADIIICRAGAGTLFEVLFFNKKCIIIPLKTKTTDHQIYNARAIAQEHPHIFQYILQDDLEKNPCLLLLSITHIINIQTNSIINHEI